MIGKSVLAGALALALGSPTEQATGTATFVTNDYIEKITCILVDNDGLHTVMGTGFKLEDGRWVSANHVTSNQLCQVDGKPITVTYADPDGDISTFTFDDNRPGGMKLDCSGYHDGQWYFAEGHADGLPVIRQLAVMAYSALNGMGAERGWSTLVYNAFIPGQSGGAVRNAGGAVTGVINAYNPYFPISYSRALKGTILCQPS